MFEGESFFSNNGKWEMAICRKVRVFCPYTCSRTSIVAGECTIRIGYKDECMEITFNKPLEHVKDQWSRFWTCNILLVPNESEFQQL